MFISCMQRMNRVAANTFFNLLSEIYSEFDFFSRLENIFKMDETGFHINYEAGAVILTKGSKDVHTIISSERGENVSIITCCSVEGRFIPPVIIFKGVRQKKEFAEGLPSGSKFFMHQKSFLLCLSCF